MQESPKLTPRQQQVLDLVQSAMERTGAPPTRAEIASELGFRSANAAEEHLRALARKGVIALIPGTSRGIQLKDTMREQLGLPRTPFRIECYDIATLGGKQSVGSMVVMEDGKPARKAYRQFKIRHTYDAPNDYAMMREVLTRRLERAVAGDPKFLPLPDLLLVDGGQGQLSVAESVCAELGFQQLPLAALAKQQEHLFRPGRAEPIVLEPRCAALRVLRALRDEAHRVANTLHQRLRRGDSLRSVLDDIPGIGAARRTLLLTHFRSTDAIRAASIEELAALPGMNRPAAETVKRYLSGEADSEA